MLGGEAHLDLFVFDDATQGGVHQEHAAWLHSTLFDDTCWVDVDHTGLAGHDHNVVVGDPITPGTKAVAVQHRANNGAVGEGHAGGAIPRLHQRAVEAVKGSQRGVHRCVVFPGFGDHHQHRVGKAAPTEVEQLEDFVEARRVGTTWGADRECAL